jgi:hypothetical protein
MALMTQANFSLGDFKTSSSNRLISKILKLLTFANEPLLEDISQSHYVSSCLFQQLNVIALK